MPSIGKSTCSDILLAFHSLSSPAASNRSYSHASASSVSVSTPSMPVGSSRSKHFSTRKLTTYSVGGGFFTGKYTPESDAAGKRFDATNWQGQAYRRRYWNDLYFKALDILRPVCEKHGLTLAEVALRWMSHHSLMKRKYNDAVLIGASSTRHIEQVRLSAILDKRWQAHNTVEPP